MIIVNIVTSDNNMTSKMTSEYSVGKKDIGKFTSMFEKFPMVNDAKEVESGGGKTTFEATYKGKRDQLDRDVIRATKELGWKVKKIRTEGARSTWKKM